LEHKKWSDLERHDDALLSAADLGQSF
jgi:hypothetical protein